MHNSTSKPADDLRGEIFGGYELKELVGTGGMACIYKGYDETLSRWVAIKVVPVYAAGGAEEILLARFRQEARAIAALRHRNILTIYGYGEEAGWAYIVMEYVPGGSLKDRLESGQPFSWEQALNVVIPVAQALAFAHERGVIHRDIKPANILLPQEDWPLLADFGLAKMEHATRPNLTMPGQVLGTMAYAAPEQIQEGIIDARVDIYSLGIVLYELLTGRLPFKGGTAFDFLMARLTDPPLPLLKANPHVDPLFVPIMDKALAQNPNARYQTMIEFYEALRAGRDQLRRSSPGKGQEARIRFRVVDTDHEIIPTGGTELLIGRASKQAVPNIDLGPLGGSQAGVSRQHARLVYADAQWSVEDLDSTNGTFVNETRLSPHQPKPVHHGDILRCGQFRLKLTIG
ncbi:MAG: FHA domain-containing serine/threonine-protein kinase [Chloroflexota bacterium]